MVINIVYGRAQKKFCHENFSCSKPSTERRFCLHASVQACVSPGPRAGRNCASVPPGFVTFCDLRHENEDADSVKMVIDIFTM